MNRTTYLEEREVALAKRDTERQYRKLVRSAASVTPRAGQWERGWRALETQARKIQARKDRP